MSFSRPNRENACTTERISISVLRCIRQNLVASDGKNYHAWLERYEARCPKGHTVVGGDSRSLRPT